MNLRDYERVKFELAELLRAVEVCFKEQHREDGGRIQELFARLAEDRFNLVVVGRFSRGKTSLMNAILGSDRLPVGIVPLTSVITTVAYGSNEEVVIRYLTRSLPSEVPLSALPEYITQRHNPGNVRQVRTAEVKLPVELLRRGFYFIDTPGLGSPIRENTRTTEAFLPEADAFVLVTSYESPLSEEELKVLHTSGASARRVFLVINKQDLVAPDDRDEVLAYIRAQLVERFGERAPPVFSVSAQEGLAAKRGGNLDRLAASGVQALEAELVRFLITEKSHEFLLRLSDRVAALVGELAPSTDNTALAERVHALSAGIAEGHRGGVPRAEGHTVESLASAPREFRPCAVCQRVLEASFDFLSRYQYDLSFRPEVRQAHAARGGLCPLHASSRSVPYAFPISPT